MSRPEPEAAAPAEARAVAPIPGRARARPAAPADRVAVWCGWVLVGAAAITPLLAWLATLGFAPLLAVMGLLSLPAWRITPRDRPILLVLLAILIWAAVSTLWSPYHPKSWSGSTTLQLALALPLGWSAICGAQRADRRLAARALRVLTWGLGLVGAVLIAETLTDARIYQWLHNSFYEPIRPDLAERNVGRTTFAAAVLWPLCMGAVQRRAEAWALVPAVAGTVMAAHVFGADAPVIAAPLALLVAMAVWRLPAKGPAILAFGAALLFELMPLLVWGARAGGHYIQMERIAPLSWAYRMDYWSHTADWIAEAPFRGWGLDASRMMGPGISLHPHNNPLQLWLELGLPGALLGAAFWMLALLRLRRRQASWPAAASAGAVCVYLLYASANFGVWQAWFLGLGGLLAALIAALPAEARETGA